MPKLKTHKGAKARFSVTGTGKVMRRRIGNSHLRRKKPKKVRRAYIGKVPVSSVDAKRIKEFIPYAG